MENRLAPLVEKNGWFKLSRFGGAMRFHWLRNSRVLLWLAVIELAVMVVEMALGCAGSVTVLVAPLMADFSLALLVVLLCSFPTARKDTTFLLRFGTPRTSVWLSNLLSLFLTGVACLLLSVVANAVTGIVGLLLAGSFTTIEVVGPATIGGYLMEGVGRMAADLPMQLLWIAEYSAIFYCVACCMRRWKIPTILVLAGVPVLLFTLLAMPVFNQVGSALESGSQNQIVALMLKLIAWLEKAGEFVSNNWQAIQGGTAVAALLFSYLIMRGTKQPE